MMIDLLMIMIRWVAGLVPGGETVAHREFLPVPVRAEFGPGRDGCYPASSPGVGWMTMRLDPVLPAHVLSQSALAQCLGNPSTVYASPRGISCSFGFFAASMRSVPPSCPRTIAVWELTITIVATAVMASLLTFVIYWGLDRLRRRDAETQAREIVRKGQLEVENRRREAELEIKEMALQQQAESEKELRRLRGELHERERLLDKRQDSLEEQAEVLRKQEKMVESTQRKLTERIQDANRRKDELSKLLDLQRQTLHELSGLSQEEATRRLLEVLDSQLQKETGAVIAAHEKKLTEICEERTREVLLTSIQRYAAAHTAETTTSTVGIPNDEMKGRIIGREGRNIRAFEKATGVDVIIDDTPGVVIVSAFDMIRREVARMSLEKLIADGRIHPTRIEEIVAGTQRELERHIQKLGEQACHGGRGARAARAAGEPAGPAALPHQLQPERAAPQRGSGLHRRHVGRRNGLRQQVGPPLRIAPRHRQGGRPRGRRRASEDRRRPVETLRRTAGSDPRRFGAPRRPARGKPVHRPGFGGRRLQRLPAGARRETLERYVKRMEELEAIAGKFTGVEQAYAIQAGRELRVIVSAKDTTDESAAKICHDIVTAFEQQLTYPGEIKVTVLRETRHVEMAK